MNSRDLPKQNLQNLQNLRLVLASRNGPIPIIGHGPGQQYKNPHTPSTGPLLTRILDRKKSIHLSSKKRHIISTHTNSSSYNKPDPNFPFYFLLRKIKRNSSLPASQICFRELIWFFFRASTSYCVYLSLIGLPESQSPIVSSPHTSYVLCY